MQCPKCQYVRTEADHHTMKGVCPACGIVYAKYHAAQDMADQHITQQTVEDDVEPGYFDDQTIKEKALSLLFDVPDRIDPVVFWSRALAYVIFFIWGGWFISTNGGWQDIGSSFLHNVNLPFHEFGHVLFAPFGRFMGILGGSLFQLMVPLIVMIVFLRQRDNFEASIMLWWFGQNFIDLTPYIQDAQFRGLPLIMGMGEESHDWGNLLTMMGMVDKAYHFGRVSFITGCIVIVASIIWGGYILKKQKANTSPW